jgi:hypothetical protein
MEEMPKKQSDIGSSLDHYRKKQEAEKTAKSKERREKIAVQISAAMISTFPEGAINDTIECALEFTDKLIRALDNE